MNKPNKQTTKKRLNIVFDQAEYDELNHYAKVQYRTVTAVIRMALDSYMKAHPLPKDK